MAIKAGVGMSRNHNPNVAGREAAEQALKKAGLSKPDFVFLRRRCLPRTGRQPRSYSTVGPRLRVPFCAGFP